jgi:hypothetical protein
MTPLKSITITRAEGPTDLCGKPRTFDSWDAARHWLLRQRPTYSAQGYAKHDCTVTWEDGSSYSLRLDCTRSGEDCDVSHAVGESVWWSMARGRDIPTSWALARIPGFDALIAP